MFILQQDHGQLRDLNTAMNRDGTEGNYPGAVRKVFNSDGTVRYDVWLKNATGGALTAGRPYMVKFGDDAADILQVAAPATNTTLHLHRYVVIALTALADTKFGWFPFAGYVKALARVDGGTVDVAAGDALEVLNTDTSLTSDGGATPTANTVAIALEANTGAAAAKDIYMLGKPVTIQAT